MTYEYNFSLSDNMINWEPHWKQLSKSWLASYFCISYWQNSRHEAAADIISLQINFLDPPTGSTSPWFLMFSVIGRQYIANILYKNCLGTFPPKHTQRAKIWKKLGNTIANIPTVKCSWLINNLYSVFFLQKMSLLKCK